MIFNSPAFALFLPVVLLLYYILHQFPRSRTAENTMLLLASCVFYGSWDHRFLFLFMFSTALDFICGLAMAHQRPSAWTAATLALLMFTGPFVLVAPIDWPLIYSASLPSDAFYGGWAEPSSRHLNSIPFTHESWLPSIAAFAGVSIETAAFVIGYRSRAHVQRRYFLVLSVVSQLVLLGFFKYFDFFISGAEHLLMSMGLKFHPWQLGIVVPVGISFYTFHTMSYTIDVYRGRLTPTRSLIDFGLFVAFFPQMVAGPIARASELLPQFEQPRRLDASRMKSAVFLIGWGLFKKIYIADNLVRLVASPYDVGSHPSGPQVLLATYAFAFQIYCDFSAYSDIARGISRLMGVELSVNFNLPYFATNPRDFWRRWHISLSTWLRDYLYLALGGNRGGTWFMYRNLMITMVLGGIWHGARANFLWWGCYQGILLCLHRLIEPAIQALTPDDGWRRNVFRAGCWLVFFHLVCYGWLLFRAESSDQISRLSRALATGWLSAGADELGVLARLVWYCWPLWIVQYFQFQSGNLLAPLCWPWQLRTALYLILFYLTVIMGAFEPIDFIYFQF